MSTPNTEFTFTQLKSDNVVTIARQNRTVAEVVEMTTQHTEEKVITLVNTNRKDKASKTKGKLADLLLSAVDETINQIFKKEGAKVIFDFIENKCNLRLEEIVEKPEAFSVDLERMLKSGAIVIEKMILKNLYRKLELRFEEKDGYEFLDYIKELKEKCGC